MVETIRHELVRRLHAERIWRCAAVISKKVDQFLVGLSSRLFESRLQQIYEPLSLEVWLTAIWSDSDVQDSLPITMFLLLMLLTMGGQIP